MTQKRPANGIRWRGIVTVLSLLTLLVVSNWVAREAIPTLDFSIRPGNEDLVHRTIMVSAAMYSLLLAIPFVPGAEIGLALMAMLGPPITLLVYLCTLIGLSISYLIGRMVPMVTLIRLSRDFGLGRTTELLLSIEPLDKKQRLEFLLERAPRRIVPALLRYRYLALALALNVPGNYLIGGGGGIALMAGVSRLFSIPGFLLTIALAVLPVPLAVLIFGSDFLPP